MAHLGQGGHGDCLGTIEIRSCLISRWVWLRDFNFVPFHPFKFFPSIPIKLLDITFDGLSGVGLLWPESSFHVDEGYELPSPADIRYVTGRFPISVNSRGNTKQ